MQQTGTCKTVYKVTTLTHTHTGTHTHTQRSWNYDCDTQREASIDAHMSRGGLKTAEMLLSGRKLSWTSKFCVWIERAGRTEEFLRLDGSRVPDRRRKKKERSPNVLMLRFGTLRSFSYDEQRLRVGSHAPRWVWEKLTWSVEGRRKSDRRKRRYLVPWSEFNRKPVQFLQGGVTWSYLDFLRTSFAALFSVDSPGKGEICFNGNPPLAVPAEAQKVKAIGPSKW